MRSAGLEKDGLWSSENIAFKLLRNGGYLDELNSIYNNSYDNMSSLGSKSTISITILSDMDEKKKKKRKKRKKKRKNKYHFGWGDWYYGGGYGDSGGDGGGGCTPDDAEEFAVVERGFDVVRLGGERALARARVS